jgi:hypothetical protein
MAHAKREGFRQQGILEDQLQQVILPESTTPGIFLMFHNFHCFYFFFTYSTGHLDSDKATRQRVDDGRRTWADDEVTGMFYF